jgi:WD40 repeat protein
VAVSPDGGSVYVASVGSDTISQYDVGAGGALTPKSPPVVATANSPFGVAVSPDGKSVYVANQGTNTVSQYDVAAGGGLTPKSPPTAPTAGFSPQGLAVSPDGGSVYAANTGSGTVSQYDVAGDGALTLKSPAAVAAGSGPTLLAVSPDGDSVYVTNQEGDSVSQYNVGAGGKLSPKSPAMVGTGHTPYGVAVTQRPPAGWEGWVTNRASGCRARVQVPYLDGNLRVTAYTEVDCPRPTRLTIRSRLRSDYPSFDKTVAKVGCTGGSACVVDEPAGFRYFRLSCPKSSTRRSNQRYYSDIIFYPGTNSGAATTERSRARVLSPFCAY